MDYRLGPGAEIEDAQPARKLNVRRVLVQQYEVRYEIIGSDIYVLRVFHTREDRP